MGQRGWPPPNQQPRPPQRVYHGNYPYPYAGHPPPMVDPRYVGPRWAAPMPRQPLPPKVKKKKRSVLGCLGAIFSFLLVSGLVVAGGLIAYLSFIAPGATLDGTDDQEVDLPPLPKGTLPASKPLVQKADAIAESSWTNGTCGDFSKERDRAEYVVTRKEGSAGALRGRVAMLHIRVGSPQLRWTRAGELNVDRAAIMSQRYVLTSAKNYQVNDVRYDVIPWSLNTGYALPPMPTNTNNRLDDATMRIIREGSKKAIETALSVPLERVVGDFKRDGYQAVAFVIYFPVKTTARDFAFSAFRGDDSAPEAAFIFSPTSEFGHFAVTVAHEGLHLFGADDLYRVQPLDKGDKHDIMGEYCTGFRQAVIGATTAYAVGWLEKPPTRGYRFLER
jgi:hypothetical protein